MGVASLGVVVIGMQYGGRLIGFVSGVLFTVLVLLTGTVSDRYLG